MVKAKRIVINARTGKIHEEEFEFVPKETDELPCGIDPKKLTKILLNKRIITDPKEIEGESWKVRRPA